VAVHGSDALERPPAYATDFEVCGEVAVREGDSLASLRRAVEQLLRDSDLPALQAVTILVPASDSGLLPPWCPAPRPASLQMACHWDYLDLFRGGRVIFRDAEPALSPWDTGPLLVLRIHQLAWSHAAKADHIPAPDV
jgi:hypothetical protein